MTIILTPYQLNEMGFRVGDKLIHVELSTTDTPGEVKVTWVYQDYTFSNTLTSKDPEIGA